MFVNASMSEMLNVGGSRAEGEEGPGPKPEEDHQGVAHSPLMEDIISSSPSLSSLHKWRSSQSRLSNASVATIFVQWKKQSPTGLNPAQRAFGVIHIWTTFLTPSSEKIGAFTIAPSSTPPPSPSPSRAWRPYCWG